MQSGFGSRVDWLVKAGAVVLAAMLALMTFNSLKLLSKTRDYLEDELEARLMNLKEIISPELSAKLMRGRDISGYLSSIALRESLDRIRLIDSGMRTFADSRESRDGALADTGPGVVSDRFDDVWNGLTVVSPVYESGEGLVRSIYFPVYDRSGRLSSVCEITLGADHIKDLTELGTTHFVLKALAVILLIFGLLYLLRTLVVGQKMLVQVASGANPGTPPPRSGDDVSFVISSFQAVVKELKDKESELRELKDRAEEKARLIESYNENVLRSVQSGVVTFDIDGHVKTMNPAAVEMLGMSEGDVAGRKVSSVFEGGRWLCDLVNNTLRQGSVKKRGEGGYVTPDGARRWLGAGTSPMAGDDGALSGAILVFTDLSEVKRLRDEMELKERMTLIGEMSTGIAHELRNPMAVISGYAKLLAKNIGQDPELVEAVDSMQVEIKGMDDIIREFMSFARPAELNLSDMDIAPVLDDAARSVGAAFNNADIRIEVDEGLPRIYGDQLLLRQAFINIIQNGVEAMDGSGILRVNACMTEASGDSEDVPPGGMMVRIDFSDHGGGIPATDIKKIFTPFYTTKSRGTGLGLALVQKIVVYHGGTISVKSGEQGATFSLYLPVRPQKENLDG